MPQTTPPSQDEAANRTRALVATTRWLRERGYPDAAPAPGGDGVDVRSARALALVDTESKAVRRPALQRLVDAREAGAAVTLVAVTSTRFELPAATFAGSKGITLLAVDRSGQIVPYDHSAALVAAGERGSPAGALPLATRTILRYAPIGVAALMYLTAAAQLVGLLGGAPGASWSGAAVSLAIGSAFAIGWVAMRRRQAATDRRRDP